MTKQPKLSKMSRQQHPFTFERRERIMNELNDAESRFREMQYRRHPHAARLALAAQEAKLAVMHLWDAMREVEGTEKGVA